jgi:hypothetical protein
VEFANRYILAVREYKKNLPVSHSWKIAFDCQQDKLAIIQHLLMGIECSHQFGFEHCRKYRYVRQVNP